MTTTEQIRAPPRGTHDKMQCEASFKTPDGHYWHCQVKGPRRAVELHMQRAEKEPVHTYGRVLWRGSANPDTRSCGNALCPGGSRAGQDPVVDGKLQLDAPEEVTNG